MSSNQRVVLTNEDDDVKVTARELVGSSPLDVTVVDGSGDPITDFGGGSGTTTPDDGNGVVTTAGTAVKVSTTATIKRVWVQNHESNGTLSNGGLIVVGASTVVAQADGRRGRALYPTQGAFFNVSNINTLYVDSVDDGAKFHFYEEI